MMVCSNVFIIVHFNAVGGGVTKLSKSEGRIAGVDYRAVVQTLDYAYFPVGLNCV